MLSLSSEIVPVISTSMSNFNGYNEYTSGKLDTTYNKNLSNLMLHNGILDQNPHTRRDSNAHPFYFPSRVLAH